MLVQRAHRLQLETGRLHRGHRRADEVRGRQCSNPPPATGAGGRPGRRRRRRHMLCCGAARSSPRGDGRASHCGVAGATIVPRQPHRAHHDHHHLATLRATSSPTVTMGPRSGPRRARDDPRGGVGRGRRRARRCGWRWRGRRARRRARDDPRGGVGRRRCFGASVLRKRLTLPRASFSSRGAALWHFSLFLAEIDARAKRCAGHPNRNRNPR